MTEATPLNWLNPARREGWARKIDGYSIASGIAVITHFAGHLELSTIEVLGLVVSLVVTEIAAFILRKA